MTKKNLHNSFLIIKILNINCFIDHMGPNRKGTITDEGGVDSAYRFYVRSKYHDKYVS